MIEFRRNRQAVCILRQPSRERFCNPFAPLGFRLSETDLCKPLAVVHPRPGVQM
jgi:hypothetical protein